ncbi:MAG: S8 family serine peptidase [Planctomycetota bacterium]
MKQQESRIVPMSCAAATAASMLLLAGCAVEPASVAMSGSAPARVVPVATAASASPVGDRPHRRGLNGIPLDALLPKDATRADRFLEQFPEYDGRGVTVAIFDTGVDPGAPGMQVTSDGRPKIVDVIDGTGSGDVDMTTVRSLEDGLEIDGLTGRTLKIPSSWSIPGGEIRVGMKAGDDLYPGGLRWRMSDEREEDMAEMQRPLLVAAREALHAFDDEHPKPTADEMLERNDLKARVELLESMMSGFDDPGPIHDCVVWHDGETWRAAVDTDEDGDFADEKALTNFRAERQFATFGDEDLLNFVLNIYDDGDTLSIVTDAGSHGTHVAGIVAAHFPDQPELDGVAPGAQIVSVKIGDHRLGSSSVNTGSVRGIISVIENDVDMINMSYGGFSSFPNRGRIADIYNDVVHEHGVIFCASVGNSGPALSTAGSPGGTTDAIIGVGAALTPEMMEAQYGYREPYSELQYAWSSRGPAIDGYRGVDITAPGGAVAPVPNWSLQRSTQMNGTSMSSPNACGGIALLLSGMKAEGREIAPHEVKRAVMATAREMKGMNPLDAGAGMLQVDRAWSHLTEYGDDRDRDAMYRVTLPGGDRGVYLREPWEVDGPFETRVDVEAFFPDEHDNRSLVDYEMRIAIEATDPWIEASSGMHLVHNGNYMRVRVDPTDLDEGLHYGEVVGYDADRPERGPLFTLPVTVIKPSEVDEGFTYTRRIEQVPGEIERQFIEIPPGATWADISVRRLDDDTPRWVVVHAMQLIEQHSASHMNNEFWINLETDEAERRSFAVVGGGTLEVASTNYWNNPGEAAYELVVDFRGVTPDESTLALIGGEETAQVRVRATAGPTAINPSGRLDTLRKKIGASSAEITPLHGPRDELPDGRLIHQLVLEYEFDLPDDGEYSMVLAIDAIPGMFSMVESTIWYLLDESGAVIDTGAGAWGSEDYAEGSYTLRMQIRSDDTDVLESLTGLGLFIDSDVSVPLSVFRDRMAVAEGGSLWHGDRMLEAGETVPVYVRIPRGGDFPEHAEPGDVLLGSITYASDAGRLSGSDARPGGYAVMLTVAPEPEEAEEPKAEKVDPADDRTQEQKLADALVDARVDFVGSLGEDDQALFEATVAEVLAEKPAHLPALLAVLDRADADDGKADDDEGTDRILEAADAVIGAIEQDELAIYYGRNHHGDDAEAMRLKNEMGERKEALIDALHRRARALGEAATRERAVERTERFEDALGDLEAWDSIDGNDYRELRITRHRLHGRLGSALEEIVEASSDDPHDAGLRERKIELLEELRWEHWAMHERDRSLVDAPPIARPF